MTLRGRLDRLERRGFPGDALCQGCGWRGPIAYFNKYVDAAGRTVRLEDSAGNQLPGIPDIPSCDLCNDQIKYVVVRCTLAARHAEGPKP